MPAAAHKLPPVPSEPMEDPNSPEARARATAQLRAMGIDDEVVFSGTADEVMAYLDATEPCASST